MPKPTKEELNQPKLRFPEFEGDWEVREFGEVYAFKRTNSFSRSMLNYNKGVILNIHYGDIHTKFRTLFDINKEYVPYVNSNINLDRITEDSYCQKGDIVIADASENYNDIGKAIEVANLDSKQVLAGLHTILARPDKKYIAYKFGAYLMQSNYLRYQIKIIAQGIKVLGISAKKIAKVKVLLPNKKEQQKIASFLSAIDHKRQTLAKQKTLWTQYKKGIMQQIFSQQIRFKQENGEDFPAWEEKRLGEVAENISYGIGSAAKKFDGRNKYLRITDIDEESNKYYPNPLTSPSGEIDRRFYLKENDIVFARTGASTGKTYLYNKSDGLLVYAGFLIKFSITKANAQFIFQNTLTYEYKKWVSVMSMRSGQPGLNVEELKSYTFNCPSFPEQTLIASFLTSIDQKIQLLDQQIKLMDQYKGGLLQQLFC